MNDTALQRVIVNVDVGTDDALSLMILFLGVQLGLVKIEAIVCTYGNTNRENVVTNLVRILELANQTQIPVYRGALLPIIPPTASLGDYMGKDGFGDLSWDSEPDLSIVKDKPGVEAMYELVKEYPGEITLISTAPLTNIALAIRTYDDFLENVKEVWFMGGDYKGKVRVTFNVRVDPEAAYILFNATTRHITMLPWETCHESTPIPPEWRFDVLGRSRLPAMEAITRAEKKIQDSSKTRWDCCGCILAASFLLKEKLITEVEQYYMGVELHGSQTRGVVLIYPPDKYERINARVIQGVTLDLYKELLLNVGIGNTEEGAEFNFFVDPEAAYILFNATTKYFNMVPWEACNADVTPISMAWRYDVLGQSTLPAMEAITKAEKTGHKGESQWVCCGCILATSLLLKEKVVTKMTPYSMGIELHGSQTRGMVVIYPPFMKKRLNAHVIQEVNFELYKDILLEMAEVNGNV